MKTPRRRERDESRVLPDMGAALGWGRMNYNGDTYATNDKQEYAAQMLQNVGAFDEAASIDHQGKVGGDSVKVRSGNSRNIMNYGQKLDSRGYTDQVREYMAATDEKATADANDKKRKKGKTHVFKIDTNPTSEANSLADAEIVDDGRRLPPREEWKKPSRKELRSRAKYPKR